jgi:hypothetical protein
MGRHAWGNGCDRYRLANPVYFDDYVRHGFTMGRLGTVLVFRRNQMIHQQGAVGSILQV